VFCGREPIVSIWGLITQALSLNKVLNVALWPNVYTTVSEISHIGLEEISEVSGSIVLFFMALIFLLLYFLGTIQSRKDPGPKRAFTIIMVFWFIGMYLACFSGRRFTVFLHIPLGFSLGVGVSGTLAYLKKKFKLPFGFLVLGLLIVLGGIDFANSYERARTIFPLMNSSWYKILTQLKNNSPADATIDSWWDYGDWFKAVAARRVIFDGQSQNTPQAYWMANCLLSDNEEESVRILKMLNNGGNRAYELINYGLKDPLRSVLLLKKLFSLKPETARLELSFLARPKVEEVMRLLFDRPPKAFFIVDNAMCDKMGSISYLGSWDFIKAYLAKRAEGADLAEAEDHIFKIKASGRKEIEKFSKEAALADQEDLGELVSQRFRIHSRLLSGQEKDGLVLFDKGFVFRPKEQLVYLYSPRLDRFRIPKSLFVFDNNQFKETPYPKNDLGLSLLVFKDKQEYRAVLLDRPLAVSLFSRLYFLNAAGLKHFKPFMEEKVADGVIRVFEIIWE
ncbi:MAG: hypothetical protein NT033_00440, partial [Candidatus Omnitrophica bacterium]|nr:hypothetical protein [Candidatus Omnitrophota bacterium]